MNKTRVSIVTGAARGIGLGIARALAGRGDQLVLVDVIFNEDDACQKVLESVCKDAVLKAVDITDAGQVNSLVSDAEKQFDRIDCMVNSVGVVRPAPVQEATESDWDLVIGVNLKGAFLVTRSVAKPMIAQQFGRIVHIASTAAHTSSASASIYSASKHGVVGLTRGAACDLAQYGITVNAICPGNNDTEMLRIVIAERAKSQGRTLEDVLDEINKKTPAGRIGKPEDVAAAALFLTSDEAEYITGQMLTVDGGRSLNLV